MSRAARPRTFVSRILELGSDSATYGVSSLLTKLVNFLLLPLYTRFLTPSDYGILAMLAILLTAGPPLANLGMTNAVFRQFNLATHRQRAVIASALSSVLGSTVLFLAVGLAIAPALGRWLIGAPGQDDLIRWTLVTIAVSTIGEVPMVTLRAERRVRTAAAINVARALAGVGLTVYLVVSLGLGAKGVVLGILAGEAVAAALSFQQTASWLSFRLDRGLWREMMAYGLPFVPHRLQAAGIALFGQYVIRHQLDLDQAGLYNVALRFTAPALFFVSSIQRAWVPFKFEIHREEADPAGFFRRALTLYTVLVGGLWVVIALWGPPLVRALTPETFHPAAALLPIVAGIPVAQGLYYMLGSGLELGRDVRPLPVVSFGGLVVVVLFSLLLVPATGAAGAAIATIGGWAMMALLVYRMSQKRLFVPYDWRAISVVLASGTLIAIAASRLQTAPATVRWTSAAVLTLLFPVVVWLARFRHLPISSLFAKLGTQERRSTASGGAAGEE